jgi:hypothetical protein
MPGVSIDDSPYCGKVEERTCHHFLRDADEITSARMTGQTECVVIVLRGNLHAVGLHGSYDIVLVGGTM